MNATIQQSAQLDALQLMESVRERIVDFSTDDRFCRDERLGEIARRLWRGPPSHGGLVSELWVEGAFPAETCDSSLQTLAHNGTFNSDLCRVLDKSGGVTAVRPLYKHQREAILRAKAGRGPERDARPALVVTAGTGAGKTECFLLPILNDLYDVPRAGGGVRCLILYPMNALVNDQVDRLYGWLDGQSKVTLFHFTSETPENKRAADHDRTPEWSECRYRTRQQARGLETRQGRPAEAGRPPDILITNYSMLEYMLCRPQDSVFFGSALQALVLDEAHLYTGTLAAEIALLLRRLLVRCGVSADQVLQIATSATLGAGSEDELRDFAATLFDKNHEAVHVIEGSRAGAPLQEVQGPCTPATVQSVNLQKWLDRPLLVADHAGTVSLAESRDLCDRLRDRLAALTSFRGSDSEFRPAVVLHEALGHAPIIHRLEEILWSRRHLSLNSLSRELWSDAAPDAIRATLTLLQLAAAARPTKDSYPLVPHRLHLLVRSTDGLSVCTNRECSAPDQEKLSHLGLGAVSAGTSEKCGYCSAKNLRLLRCGNCGESVLGGYFHQATATYCAATVPVTSLDFFTTQELKDPRPTRLTLNVETGARTGAGGAGLAVTMVDACPRCNAGGDQFQGFASGHALTLAIVTETVLAELPEFPAIHNPFLPARGRRLLAFSDSRQEAARLGPRLTRQHETQLVRAAVVQSLHRELAADAETIDAERREIARLKKEAKSAVTPAAKQRAEILLRDAQKRLESYLAGGMMSDWAKAIGDAQILAEVLDIESAQRHVVRELTAGGDIREWSQRDWERNWEHVRRNTMTLLAREFMTPNWRAISTETFGLAEVTYPGLQRLEPPSTFLGSLPSEEARTAISSCWYDLLCALCDTLRSAGAITFGHDDADRAYDTGGAPVGQWAAKSEVGHRLIRFVGQTAEQLRRRFTAAVLRSSVPSLEQSDELGRELLEAVFEQLHAFAVPKGSLIKDDRLPWLECDGRQAYDGSVTAAIRLRFPELGLRRPAALYLCERTGHLWPRSVAECAPETGCVNTLRQLSEDEIEGDPRRRRLRNEYRSSRVFSMGLWAEEHSAQLSPQQNRRLQDLFKAGIRNILSATTTLELGIDIGGLTAALMSNVPPGKANYLQRAGRAGRRSDGSASVVTFARPNPFDREVFHRFGEYLAQPLRKPLVFLDRERIARRHLHAFLLGEFFRALYGPAEHKGAMDAFGNMGRFCGKPSIPYWEPSAAAPVLSASPASLEAQFRRRLFELKDYGDSRLEAAAKNLFDDTGLKEQLRTWPELVQQVIDSFSAAIDDWARDYDLMCASWLDAVGDGNRPQANAVRYQLKLLAELTVIEALADRQFLPRYGFPIGLQKLRVIAPDPDNRDRVREEDQFRLERSGILAIGEYVPGSQLLAGGKLITSRGLLKHWTGAALDSSPGLRGRFCKCENDHPYYWIAGDPDSCPICDGLPKHSPRELLFVKHGFTSAAWDPPKWSTEVGRIGTAETLSLAFRPNATTDSHLVCQDFAGVAGLSADYRDDGQLLVYNRGEHQHGFAICLRCGYADSEVKTANGKMNLPAHFEHHIPISSTKGTCWPREGDGVPVLRNQILSATETTDVLLLDFTDCLGPRASDEDLMTTIAYACQAAAAKLLELDRRELGVLLVPTGRGGRTRGPVIYDNVSGGAGHVRELLEQGRDWLAAARRVLFVNEDHDQRCESGCLDCLLSFDAQRAMANKPFVRRAALQAIETLLG